MGYTRYGKKVFEWDDLSGQEIFEKLTEYFLHSGFLDEWQGSGYTLDDLRAAIEHALTSQEVMPLEELERLMDMEEELRDSRLSQLTDALLDRLVKEGYVAVPETSPGMGTVGLPGETRFELTDKGLDFLGYKTLKETLSRVGRDAFGRHASDRLATGVESGEAPKPYRFGDAMNLDSTATVMAAVRRTGGAFPIALEEEDLHVHQGELRIASATVLMLDCSHSMILYGEDRFTPAKRVALALSHLIRTRYPGDELSLVLFHDEAEEVPLRKLPRLQVGPYHTNTAAGLKLARRILARTRREMKQVVMITDGKPSALTLPDGRIYKNSFGLDPLILKATFDEVAACRRSAIRINTFMLARDRSLVAFVRKVSEIARGKAYFTSPTTLGRTVTQDFMSGRSDTLN